MLTHAFTGNRIETLLATWYPLRDQMDWALASVIRVSGSAYRKPGALMLINSQGESFGMLSGGCLEADIRRNAQKSIALNKTLTLVYEADAATQSKHLVLTGCGGTVEVWIQPIHRQNDYQNLIPLYSSLSEGVSCRYQINRDLNNQCVNQHDAECHVFTYQAAPRLAIFGAGPDAVPLAHMASMLGWHIYLFDHRQNRVAINQFPQNCQLNSQPPAQRHIPELDAAVVMGHQLSFDRAALAQLNQLSSLKYLGLLGPVHRKSKILSQLTVPLQHKCYGPIGLHIGGQLPEEIALSCLSQIQAVLQGKSL